MIIKLAYFSYMNMYIYNYLTFATIPCADATMNTNFECACVQYVYVCVCMCKYEYVCVNMCM